MSTPEQKTNKLQKILAMMDESLTREEFVGAFKNVVEYVKKFETQLVKDFKDLLATVNKKVDDKLATVKDGRDGKNGKDGKDGAAGPKGDTGEPGEKGESVAGPAGKDGSPDMAEDVRNKLELLEGDERLKLEAIRGLELLIEDIKQLKARPQGKGGGTRGFTLYVNGVKKLLTAQTLNITGSGVSYNYANGRNDVTITGGTGSLSVLTATGTINDSNKTFTFASAPTIIVVNGAVYRDGHGCTISGTTVTLDNPVGTGGDIYALG